MAKPKQAGAGVVNHGSWAILVTVGPADEILDRRRIELVDDGMPTHPHHHEGQSAMGRYLRPGQRRYSLAEAVALVERVRECAQRRARENLEALAAVVPVSVASLSILKCPTMPATTEEQIADSRAQTFADNVMYRQALASAAEALGWTVHWYDSKRVLADAAATLRTIGQSIDPPWTADHKLAAAAALATRIA